MLKLERNKNLLIIDWDAEAGKLMLTANNDEPIIFTFNESDRIWESSQNNGLDILNKNIEDIKLMLAIFDDTSDYTSPNYSEDEEVNSSSICPDYDNRVKGGPEYDTYRNLACEAAHADAASKCSNEYCYGCYSYVGTTCDCACLQGDMWCNCIRYGYPCTSCDY